MAAILPAFHEYGTKIGAPRAGRGRDEIDGHAGDPVICLPHGSLRCALLRSTNARIAGMTGQPQAIVLPSAGPKCRDCLSRKPARLQFEGFAGGVGVDLARVQSREHLADLVEIGAMQFAEMGVQVFTIRCDDHREGHRVKLQP